MAEIKIRHHKYCLVVKVKDAVADEIMHMLLFVNKMLPEVPAKEKAKK